MAGAVGRQVVDTNLQSLRRGAVRARANGVPVCEGEGEVESEARLAFVHGDFTRPGWHARAPSDGQHASAPGLGGGSGSAGSGGASGPLSAAAVPAVDLVVALHACGGLSDAALGWAVSRGCCFLVCPCCYLKTPQLVPMGRLGWPSVLRRAAAAATEGGAGAEAEAEALRRLAESEHAPAQLRAQALINECRRRACEAEGGGAYEWVHVHAMPRASTKRNLVLVGCAK